jgi:CheY-like chemotaxis protein
MHPGLPALGHIVLVVDDNRPLRRLMRLELEVAGYSVMEAQDGLEALRRLQEHPVTAVVSDFRMPRLDGLGLLGEIRRQWGDLPVALVSAGLRPDEADGARVLGVNAVLQKPIEHDSLLEVVHRLCHGVPVASHN